MHTALNTEQSESNKQCNGQLTLWLIILCLRLLLGDLRKRRAQNIRQDANPEIVYPISNCYLNPISRKWTCNTVK